MAGSTIDALLQIAAPQRAGEAPPRAGERPAPFEPALERALSRDKAPVAAAPVAAAQPPAAETAVPDADSHAVDDEAPHDAEHQSPSDRVADELSDEPAEADEDATDEVEISAAAEAVAKQAEVDLAGGALAAEEGELAIVADQQSAQEQESNPSDQAGSGKRVAGQVKPVTDDSGETEAADVKSAPSTAAILPTDAPENSPRTAKARADKGGDQKGKSRASADPVHSSDSSAAIDANASGEGAASEHSVEFEKPALAAEASPREEATSKAPHGPRRPVAPASQAPVAAISVVEVTVSETTDASSEQSGGGPAAADSAPPQDRAALPSALERLAAPRSVRPALSADQQEGPQVDRARFIGRVEGALRAAQQRDGRVQVRLSPPELGSLRIELTVQQGVLAARIEADTPAARNLLLDNLPALRERLAAQDMRVEKFDVDVRRDGGGSSGGSAQDRQPDQPGWRGNDRPQRSAPTPAAPRTGVIRAAGPSRISDAELDVCI